MLILPSHSSQIEHEPPEGAFARRKAVVFKDCGLDAKTLAEVGALIDNAFPGRGVLVSGPTYLEDKDNIYTGSLTALLSSHNSPDSTDPITGLLHEKELRLQQLKLAAQLGLVPQEEAERRSREWHEKPKPQIKQTIIDIDGTLLKMKYNDEWNTGFTNSQVGIEVIGRLGDLIDECVREGIQGIDKDKTLTKDPMSFVRNAEVCSYLETMYGGMVKNEMMAEFCELYGEERGISELNTFLERYLHMPLGYHIFRWITHGMVDINKVFEKPADSTVPFIGELIQSGIKPVFLTASPRIHAVRMLRKAGLMEALKDGKISLMTAEDLYHPESLSEMSKAVAIAACTWREDENALEKFKQIANCEVKANKMYQTYLNIRNKRVGSQIIPLIILSLWEIKGNQISFLQSNAECMDIS